MSKPSRPISGEKGFSHIAIIGFGMIGASFAAAVRETIPEIYLVAVDIDEQTLSSARELDWADEALLPDDPAFKEYIEQRCDLVMLAAPIDAIEAYLHDLASWDYKGVITDTTSTKAHITKMATDILLYPQNFIPGHPMAGSEKNGIDGARGDLFKGAHWILCPDEDTPPQNFTRLHELITAIGARVIVIPRDQHDKAVAVVSHVPHFVASSLMQLATRHADDQQALLRLAAGGFKDSTRIAAGSPELWVGIAFDNREAILDGLDEICRIINSFKDALSENDKVLLTSLLADAADARRALPAAWVPSTEKLLEVRIPMEDRTGVIAEVTTIAGKVGCNIQSIEIDHMTEDSAVLSLILTDEGDIGQLSAQLINAGFSVSFNPLSAKENVHVES